MATAQAVAIGFSGSLTGDYPAYGSERGLILADEFRFAPRHSLYQTAEFNNGYSAFKTVKCGL